MPTPNAARDALTPERVARFAADWAALAPGEGALLLAISGGPDSLALLRLTHAAGFACEAATVDHGLRMEAADETAKVAAICGDLGIVHATLKPDSPIAPGGNLQARARAARYDALARHGRATGVAAIVTAHHADDQAETLLMRLARGSGIDGLAGVRAVGDWGGMTLLRPLLGWRRAELAEIAAPLGPVDDPTNRDPAHDRTRIRALLAVAPDLDVAGIARSAAALADAREAIAWSTAALAEVRIDGDAIDPAGLPREYRRRLLALALARAGAAESRGPALDRLLAELDGGKAGMIGDLLVRIEHGKWRLAPAPPRRSR